jgi:hypothetical protein
MVVGDGGARWWGRRRLGRRWINGGGSSGVRVSGCRSGAASTRLEGSRGRQWSSGGRRSSGAGGWRAAGEGRGGGGWRGGESESETALLDTWQAAAGVTCSQGPVAA